MKKLINTLEGLPWIVQLILVALWGLITVNKNLYKHI